MIPSHMPEYLPGEIVLHRIPSHVGEVLYTAMVVGLFWEADHWEYCLSVLPDHPQFEENVYNIEWFNSWQLEKLDLRMRQLLSHPFCWSD